FLAINGTQTLSDGC
ncbi:hypothetical protein MKD33_19960, partial [Chromobacterium piscinae]